MSKDIGVIYILTNPSFPDYVKIGYADDVEQRLRQLNRSECVPFAFQVYAIYEVGHRLADLNLHSIIDRLNPNLRAIENFNGKRRAREFYAMSPEDAYSLLEAIAMMHGRTDKLRLIANKSSDGVVSEGSVMQGVSTTRGAVAPSADTVGKVGKPKQQKDKSTKTGRAKPFSFPMCNIPVGAVIEYCREGDVNSGLTCRVMDDKHVEYEGLTWSLSSLAQMLLGSKSPVQGTLYFKYNGEWLNDIRQRMGV